MKAKCLICGKKTSKAVVKNSKFKNSTVMKCESCNFCFLNPMPSNRQLLEIYSKEWSWDYGIEKNNSLKSKILKAFVEKFSQLRNNSRSLMIQELKSKLSGNTVLEIGCGDGELLEKLSNKGFEAFAIEPSENYTRQLEKKGIKVLGNDISSFHANEKFDLVLMIMVLEHLPNPSNALKKVKELMKGDSLLIIEVPQTPMNTESLSCETLKSVFDNIHALHFTKNSLEKFLKKQGFRIESSIRKKPFKLTGAGNVFQLHPSENAHGIIAVGSAILNAGVLVLKDFFGQSIFTENKKDSDWEGPGDWIECIAKKRVRKMNSKGIQEHFEKQHQFAFNPPRDIRFVFYDTDVWEYAKRFLKNSKVCVDLGCGSGSLLYNASKVSKGRLIGVDLCKAATKRMKKFFPRIEVMNEDVTKTSLPAESCDICFSTQTIEHMDDKKFLKEAFRILKPGGCLVVTTVMKTKNAWYFNRDDKGKVVLEKSHLREYGSIKEFTSLLKHSGFTVLKAKTPRIKFPLIDVLMRSMIIAFKNEFFYQLPTSKLGEILRLLTRVPIPGYYAIEVVCVKKQKRKAKLSSQN